MDGLCLSMVEPLFHLQETEAFLVELVACDTSLQKGKAKKKKVMIYTLHSEKLDSIGELSQCSEEHGIVQSLTLSSLG